jgi:hypothetical protein
VDGTGSELCPMAGHDISNDHSGSNIRVLVNL